MDELNRGLIVLYPGALNSHAEMIGLYSGLRMAGADQPIEVVRWSGPYEDLFDPPRRYARNREWEPFDRSIDIRVGRLRRKVEPDPDGEPRCIRTVRNAGYMFIPDTGESRR